MSDRIIPYDEAVTLLNGYFVGTRIVPPRKRKARLITAVTIVVVDWGYNAEPAIRLHFDDATHADFELSETAETISRNGSARAGKEDEA